MNPKPTPIFESDLVALSKCRFKGHEVVYRSETDTSWEFWWCLDCKKTIACNPLKKDRKHPIEHGS